MGRFLVRLGIAVVCTIAGLQFVFGGIQSIANQYPFEESLVALIVGAIFLIGAAAMVRYMMFGRSRPARRVYHYHYDR